MQVWECKVEVICIDVIKQGHEYMDAEMQFQWLDSTFFYLLIRPWLHNIARAVSVPGDSWSSDYSSCDVSLDIVVLQ